MKDLTEIVARALRKFDVEVGTEGNGVVDDFDWGDWLPSAQAVLAALREAGALVEWRGIESAPKDGSRVLLGKIVGHPSHKTALWWAVAGYWSERWKNWNDGVEPSGLAGPTHWSPLPKPPEGV